MNTQKLILHFSSFFFLFFFLLFFPFFLFFLFFNLDAFIFTFLNVFIWLCYHDRSVARNHTIQYRKSFHDPGILVMSRDRHERRIPCSYNCSCGIIFSSCLSHFFSSHLCFRRQDPLRLTENPLATATAKKNMSNLVATAAESGRTGRAG